MANRIQRTIFHWGCGVLIWISACKTAPITHKPIEKPAKPAITEEEKILQSDFFTREGGPETFRVYISSDRYLIRQYKFKNTIRRQEDKGGDAFIKDYLTDYNKIDEERIGMVRVTLYPNNGTINKIRPERLTFISELDRIMIDDVQRWQFSFPRGVIYPVNFLIRYKFKLKREIGKQKSMEDLEKEYLKKNPKFREYLYKKKRYR